MKLKKFVSLALAGVLAVSMLAGCKANNGSSSSEQPATGVNATTVIAALDKKVTEKVEFKASTSLQATVDKASEYAKAGVVEFKLDLLQKLDNKLSSEKLAKVDGTNSIATDKDVQKYTFIVDSSKLMGASVEATANELASQIAKAEVSKEDSLKTIKDLPAKSSANLGTAGDQYRYEFKYTADVAVTSATNANGQVTYYAVVTLTRTPSRGAAV